MLIEFDGSMSDSEASQAVAWFDEHSEETEPGKEFFLETSFGNVPARLDVYVDGTGLAICVDTDRALNSEAMHELLKFMHQFVHELDDIFVNRLQCKSIDNSSEIVRPDINTDIKIHSRSATGETSIWEMRCY